MMERHFNSRLNRSSSYIALVYLGVTLIIISELLYYLHLTSASVVSGVTKTYVYGMILLSAMLVYMQRHKRMETSVRIFLVFTVMTTISTILGITSDISTLRQIIHISYFAAVFLTFYIGAEYLNDERALGMIRVMYLIMVVIYIINYFRNGISKDSVNAIYYVFIFLPTTVLFKSKGARLLLYTVQIFVVLLSSKRTPLLALVAYSLVSEFVANKQISTQKKVVKVLICITATVALYVIFPIIMQKLNIPVLNDLTLSSIQQDEGSNRFFIYSQLWERQTTGSISHWLIGSGYNAVLLTRVCTDGFGGGWVSAHNDFLEVLYDYGVIGLSLYVAFYISILNIAGRMVKTNYRFANAFVSSIFMVLVISLSSHLIIYLNYFAVVFMFWGYCLSDYRHNYVAE